jgi:hypothetical protein
MNAFTTTTAATVSKSNGAGASSNGVVNGTALDRTASSRSVADLKPAVPAPAELALLARRKLAELALAAETGNAQSRKDYRRAKKRYEAFPPNIRQAVEIAFSKQQAEARAAAVKPVAPITTVASQPAPTKPRSCAATEVGFTPATLWGGKEQPLNPEQLEAAAEAFASLKRLKALKGLVESRGERVKGLEDALSEAKTRLPLARKQGSKAHGEALADHNQCFDALQKARADVKSALEVLRQVEREVEVQLAGLSPRVLAKARADFASYESSRASGQGAIVKVDSPVAHKSDVPPTEPVDATSVTSNSAPTPGTGAVVQEASNASNSLVATTSTGSVREVTSRSATLVTVYPTESAATAEPPSSDATAPVSAAGGGTVQALKAAQERLREAALGKDEPGYQSAGSALREAFAAHEAALRAKVAPAAPVVPTQAAAVVETAGAVATALEPESQTVRSLLDRVKETRAACQNAESRAKEGGLDQSEQAARYEALALATRGYDSAMSAYTDALLGDEAENEPMSVMPVPPLPKAATPAVATPVATAAVKMATSQFATPVVTPVVTPSAKPNQLIPVGSVALEAPAAPVALTRTATLVAVPVTQSQPIAQVKNAVPAATPSVTPVATASTAAPAPVAQPAAVTPATPVAQANTAPEAPAAKKTQAAPASPLADPARLFVFSFDARAKR